MIDEQTAEIQGLKADLKKLQAENEKLKPALKEAQENLVALENYTRRENLRFMNIPESRGENCQDIIYDVLENDLKMNAVEIRFHAVHRVGKPRQNNGATPPRPRQIIARFVVREDRDAVTVDFWILFQDWWYQKTNETIMLSISHILYGWHERTKHWQVLLKNYLHIKFMTF